MYLYSVCLYLYLCQCICICDCLSTIWYSPQCRVKDAHRAEDLELHTTTAKKLLSSQQDSTLFQMSVQYHSPLKIRFPPPADLFKKWQIIAKAQGCKRDIKMARVDRRKGSGVQLNEMLIMLNE